MKKVLVADDTKNIRVLLSTCLEVEGYTVLTANDGQQSLELLTNENFDLAFLDIKMPEISGTEVLRRIREKGINTPIIIITAFATVKNAVECTKLGAVAYLQKPFTADKVRNVLSELECTTSESNQANPFEKINNCIENSNYEDAINLLKKALSDQPSNAELYLLFAQTYEQMGDIENAKKFSSAHEIFKNKE